MSRVQSSFLLLAGLLLLGWGIASWLEEGAPWKSLSRNAAELSTNSPAVDVRELIHAEASRQREPNVTPETALTIPSLTSGASEIELTSGTAVAQEVNSTPAWLTGEIEF